MDREKKSGYRTLLLSVLMSSYGPIILGLGLRVGHSSTQIADFTRRTSELLSLIVAFMVYAITNRQQGIAEEEKRVLERKGNLFTGVIMCINGCFCAIKPCLYTKNSIVLFTVQGCVSSPENAIRHNTKESNHQCWDHVSLICVLGKGA